MQPIKFTRNSAQQLLECTLCIFGILQPIKNEKFVINTNIVRIIINKCKGHLPNIIFLLLFLLLRRIKHSFKGLDAKKIHN